MFISISMLPMKVYVHTHLIYIYVNLYIFVLPMHVCLSLKPSYCGYLLYPFICTYIPPHIQSHKLAILSHTHTHPTNRPSTHTNKHTSHKLTIHSHTYTYTSHTLTIHSHTHTSHKLTIHSHTHPTN